ncbi:MAG: CPBP family intramembrane metalloprotease [FCB group bacterium]|nr:CPBP family intramembrane metalloprotease [FCB group bacterium]
MITYWRQSQSLFYSLITVFPLLIIYEIGLILVQSLDLPPVRNSADVLLQSVFSSVGIQGMLGLGLVFIAGTVIAFYWNRNRDPNSTFSSRIVIGIVGESFFWGLILVLIMQSFQALLMNPTVFQVTQQVILGLGAGIFEEFLFRVLLISGFVPILILLFQWSPSTAKIVAVLLAAALFSWFHFLGPLGEQRNTILFLVRFIAGGYLGLLFIFRGFGITAWTHAVYDLLMIIQITVFAGNQG